MASSIHNNHTIINTPKFNYYHQLLHMKELLQQHWWKIVFNGKTETTNENTFNIKKKLAFQSYSQTIQLPCNKLIIKFINFPISTAHVSHLLPLHLCCFHYYYFKLLFLTFVCFWMPGQKINRFNKQFSIILFIV